MVTSSKQKRSSGRNIRQTDRMVSALRLRLAGLTLEEIVSTGLYASRGAVSNAIARALEMEVCETVDQYRSLNQKRLEKLLQSSWGRALKGDLKAVDACRKIIKDLRDLFGLDAPIRFRDDTPPPPDEEVRAEIAAINARIDAMPVEERRLLARSLFTLEDGFSDN